MKQKIKTILIGLFILFMLLLNVPFISTPSGSIGNIPVLMIYFGIIWTLFIICMGLVYGKRHRNEP